MLAAHVLYLIYIRYAYDDIRDYFLVAHLIKNPARCKEMGESSKIHLKIVALSSRLRRLTVIICHGGRENKCQTKGNEKETDILAHPRPRTVWCTTMRGKIQRKIKMKSS